MSSIVHERDRVWKERSMCRNPIKEQIALQGNQTNMSLHLALALENEVTKWR